MPFTHNNTQVNERDIVLEGYLRVRANKVGICWGIFASCGVALHPVHKIVSVCSALVLPELSSVTPMFALLLLLLLLLLPVFYEPCAFLASFCTLTLSVRTQGFAGLRPWLLR